jgi:protocatechuate 3,4-dioxygenase beta subunit
VVGNVASIGAAVVLLSVVVLGVGVSGASGKSRPEEPEPDCRVVKVVDRKGRPVVGANVTLLPCDSDAKNCGVVMHVRSWPTNRNGRICAFADVPAVKSSADGRFSFAAVAKGSAWLRVKHPDFVPCEVGARVPSSDAEIVLDEGATWQGRVFDPDGAPLADCRVSAAAASGPVASSPCSEGKFSLRRLPAGDIDVGAWTDEHSPLGSRAFNTKTRIVRNEHRQQDLSYPKGMTLAGVIVDDGGAPIAEARLSARPRDEDRPPSSFHPQQVTVRADSNGRFTFRHLEPGAWVITGDYRRVLKGKLGKLEVDATSNRDGLRLVIPEPETN